MNGTRSRATRQVLAALALLIGLAIAEPARGQVAGGYQTAPGGYYVGRTYPTYRYQATPAYRYVPDNRYRAYAVAPAYVPAQRYTAPRTYNAAPRYYYYSAPAYGYSRPYRYGTIDGFRYLDNFSTGRGEPLAKPWMVPLR